MDDIRCQAVTPMGSGVILTGVLKTAALLAGQGLNVGVLSVTSWSELAQQLAQTAGPVIAATDYVCAHVPQGRRFITPGTDGFGRSDTRAALRAFFGGHAQALLRALCWAGNSGACALCAGGGDIPAPGAQSAVLPAPLQQNGGVRCQRVVPGYFVLRQDPNAACQPGRGMADRDGDCPECPECLGIRPGVAMPCCAVGGQSGFSLHWAPVAHCRAHGGQENRT